jgi:MoaA/NifB/PqqE/SkfB family radical SAM enzyme
MKGRFPIWALTGLIKARVLSPTPLVLSHRINYGCNLRCVFCPFWREKPRGAVLEKGEIFGLIDQAADLGALLYNVWGTEPLLRDDLPECLAHAKEVGLGVSLITNGTLLEERFSQISECVDYLVISLNGTRRTYQKITGVDGYDRVMEGLRMAGEGGLKASANCVVCAYNLAELAPIARLASDLGLYATFEPVHPFPGLPEWERVRIQDRERYHMAIDTLLEMKRKGYSIGNSVPYLQLMREYDETRRAYPYTCHVGKFLLQVDPEGRVRIPCQRSGYVGSVRDAGLSEIWDSPFARRNREGSASCSSCLFSGFVEASLLFDLRPGALVNSLRIL